MRRRVASAQLDVVGVDHGAGKLVFNQAVRLTEIWGE